MEKLPDLEALANEMLATVLDDFHAREVLHVTRRISLAPCGIPRIIVR